MKTIGKYQLFAEIHRGPITTLYKAFHSQLERVVLIKQLNKDRRNDQELLDRFQQEGLIIAKINHPNVIGIFDYGIQDDAPYLVMEYIEGLSLAELLKDRGRLSIDVVLFIMYQIVAGLHALHRKNFIHRDIKPANILLSHEGQVKIGDFGFAESKLNSSGSILGTPAYMSPEIVLSQPVDERSDIFSVGILFYELLVGENPFHGNNPATIFKKIVSTDLPSINKIRPDIPDEIASICHKMVAREAKQRYPSLKPIIKELEPFVQQVNEESLADYLKNPATYIEKPIETIQPAKELQSKRRNVSYLYLPIAFVVVIITLFFLIKYNSNKQNNESNIEEKVNQAITDSLPDISENKNNYINRQSDTTKAETFIPQHSITNIENNLDQRQILKPISIAIHSDPRAWIIINGDSIGIAPIGYQIATVPLKLDIELQRPGFPSIKKEIFINSISDTIFNFLLWQEVGYLNISVNPWGEIWIDGDSVDVTPLMQPLILTPGNHQLEIHHPNREQAKETIFIVAGDTLYKSFNLVRVQ